jgi:hypothetical protein
METMEIVEAAVYAQSEEMLAREKTYQPLPATWINKGRWETAQEPGK